MTIGKLLGDHTSLKIMCPVKNAVVRRLNQRDGTFLNLDALTDAIDVPCDTPLIYEPWCFDRGNILAKVGGRTIKVCTVGDILIFPDGTRRTVTEFDCETSTKTRSPLS